MAEQQAIVYLYHVFFMVLLLLTLQADSIISLLQTVLQ
jgi:hypothetical protein